MWVWVWVGLMPPTLAHFAIRTLSPPQGEAGAPGMKVRLAWGWGLNAESPHPHTDVLRGWVFLSPSLPGTLAQCDGGGAGRQRAGG